MLEPEAAGLDAVAAGPPPPPPAPTTSASYPLGTHATGGNEVPQFLGMDKPTYTTKMLHAFQDPKMMEDIGQLAAQYQQNNWLSYLSRGHEAQKENAGHAVMKLIAGDTQGALQMFNASGQHKASAIRPIGDGTFDIDAAGPDGKTYTRRLDPMKEMATLVTPPQWMAHQDREKAVDTKLAAGEAASKSREEIARISAEARNKALTLQGDLNVARIDLAHARAKTEGSRGAYLDARTAATQAGGTANPKFNWNTFYNTLDREAKDSGYVKETNKLGKEVINGKKLADVRSMAQQLARKDNSLAESPGLALQTAIAKFEQIDAQVAERLEEDAATVEAGEPKWYPDGKGSVGDYYKKAGAKNLDEWKQKHAVKLKAEALKTVGLDIPDATKVVAAAKSNKAVSGSIGGTAAAKPVATPAAASQAAAAPSQAAAGEPAQPKTKEEYDALPPGAMYLRPSDGRVVRKK